MSSTPLASESAESLLRLTEAAPQVCRRPQFFAWTQGDLQRWLPHKVLVCGAYDRDRLGLVFDVFNSVTLPEPAMAAWTDPRSALWTAMIHAWRQHRRQPLVIDTERDPGGGPAPAALAASGHGQLLVHGLCRPGRPDEIESFFAMAHPAHRYGPASTQALDMLLGCLHLTHQRVVVTERQMSGPRLASSPSAASGLPRQSTITLREREILVWVRDGLSNQQIGEKLGISALTVKNHIQKILRKLGAANRAQAVAKAMTLNALGSTPMGPGDAYL